MIINSQFHKIKEKHIFQKNNYLIMPPFKAHIKDLEVLDTGFINQRFL